MNQKPKNQIIVGAILITAAGIMLSYAYGFLTVAVIISVITNIYLYLRIELLSKMLENVANDTIEAHGKVEGVEFQIKRINLDLEEQHENMTTVFLQAKGKQASYN